MIPPESCGANAIVVQLHVYYLLFQIAVTAAAVSSAQNDDRFPSGARGGPPQPIVQRRTFDTSSSDSWSFFRIGSSNLRDKRKLPSSTLGSAKETISDFSCRGRPPGYYADIKLGCEVSLNTIIVFENWYPKSLIFASDASCVNLKKNLWLHFFAPYKFFFEFW